MTHEQAEGSKYVHAFEVGGRMRTHCGLKLGPPNGNYPTARPLALPWPPGSGACPSCTRVVNRASLPPS